MSTAGVLLAAGGGTRFVAPQHKLLAEIGGRSVMSRSLDAMCDAGLDDVAIVCGAVDLSGVLAEAATGITVISNADWASGIATSVRRAARWAAERGHEAIVIGLADQPFVTPGAWRAVAASEAPLAVATYEERRGNPVRLASEIWPLLPHDGDEGARTLMRRLPEIVTPVACEGHPDDIDTVEDLRRWS